MADNTVPSGTFSDYSGANTDVFEFPSYYDICDRTGFRVKAGKLVEEWTGLSVRPEDWDARHPQELVRGVPERRIEQVSPEPTDEFLATNQVNTSDL